MEYVLISCAIDFNGNWDDHFSLIEIAYNNSYHSSIYMTPLEVIHAKWWRYPIGWFEVGKESFIGIELNYEAMENVRIIRERLEIAQSRKKSYAHVKWRDLEFDVND